MMALRNNIQAIQVFVGSFESLVKEFKLTTIYYKEHPLNIGYIGNEEQRDWVSKEVFGYFPSFFSYWKKMEKHMM